MSQHYSDPTRETDPHALPDVEVFYTDAGELESDDFAVYLSAGWYYWYCLPGCLPDSVPFGPYDTHAEAVSAMQEEEES